VFNTTLRSEATNCTVRLSAIRGRPIGSEWLLPERQWNASAETPFYNYGGSIGGPVIVPKLYSGGTRRFSGDEEGYRQSSPFSDSYAVPTDLERKGDFSKKHRPRRNPLQVFDPVTHQTVSGNVIPQTSLNPIGLAHRCRVSASKLSGGEFRNEQLQRNRRSQGRADESIYKLDHQFFSWWRTNVSYLHYASKEPGGNPLHTIAARVASTICVPQSRRSQLEQYVSCRVLRW